MAQTPQPGALGAAPLQARAPAASEADQARADMEAERSRDFSAYLDFLIDDSRRGNVKMTEGKDKKKGMIDRKGGGARGGTGGSMELGRARGDGDKEAGARADRAIDGASKDLSKLASLEPGAERAFKETTQLL